MLYQWKDGVLKATGMATIKGIKLPVRWGKVTTMGKCHLGTSIMMTSSFWGNKDWFVNFLNGSMSFLSDPVSPMRMVAIFVSVASHKSIGRSWDRKKYTWLTIGSTSKYCSCQNILLINGLVTFLIVFR